MTITIGSSNLNVQGKSSSGMSMGFPDVCKTLIPASGTIPIPYPNIAKTAKEKTKTASKTTATKPSSFTKTAGNEAGMTRGVISPTASRPAMVQTKVSNTVQIEVQRLRAQMSSIHQQILMLKASNPDQWQKLLEDYCVTASALYITQTPD